MRIRAALRALFDRRARGRWFHLVLGGALLMPFWILAGVVLGPFTRSRVFVSSYLGDQLLAYAVALPLAAATALVSQLRPLSVAAARALCSLPDGALADGPARSRATRTRAAAWFTLHTGVGALVSGASLALPPFAASTALVPFVPPMRTWLRVPDFPFWVLALFPVAGVAMLLALAGVSAAAGALLARAAQALLGPTPADRLAAAERRANELAERNRLARELHDSVGHALSAVTLQAGAARRVVDRDPEFVRQALEAIEETARRTVDELDTVLGLLRDDGAAGADEAVADGPTLAELDGLLARSGVPVDSVVDSAVEGAGGSELKGVPAPVSRAAYRIVQEGLSNALRHAGAVPVSLRIARRGAEVARRGEKIGRHGEGIARRGEELEITMENPLPARAPVVRPGGGRGVAGMVERAAALGGVVEAGPADGVWRLYAKLPLNDRSGGTLGFDR
ncbi:histidine kinase [Streptomyces sp. NPDC047315]|uniref:sensor histidine kinase n=1 Tax=Streptomyces sp. NPDC047315 TaxID=3155142 RepID=UPI0033DC2132